MVRSPKLTSKQKLSVADVWQLVSHVVSCWSSQWVQLWVNSFSGRSRGGDTAHHSFSLPAACGFARCSHETKQLTCALVKHRLFLFYMQMLLFFPCAVHALTKHIQSGDYKDCNCRLTVRGHQKSNCNFHECWWILKLFRNTVLM